MAERIEAKSAKRCFASKYLQFGFLTRSFAVRFLLRFAQPFLAKSKLTTNWPLLRAEVKKALTVSECKMSILAKLARLTRRSTFFFLKIKN